jgi:hypothetical protein
MSEIAMLSAKDWYTSYFRGEKDEPSLKVWRVVDGSCFRLRIMDGTEFFLSESETKSGDLPENLTLEDTATYLLGPIFGFLLRLRGVTCLHASAIAVDGKAIALIGPPALESPRRRRLLHSRAIRCCQKMLSPCVIRADEFLIQPGYPLIRLWPESVRGVVRNGRSSSTAYSELEQAIPRSNPERLQFSASAAAAGRLIHIRRGAAMI